MVAQGKSASFKIHTNDDAGDDFTASCNSESLEFAIGSVQIVPGSRAMVRPALADSLLDGLVVFNNKEKFRNKL